jgi:hypothetical protein
MKSMKDMKQKYYVPGSVTVGGLSIFFEQFTLS